MTKRVTVIIYHRTSSEYLVIVCRKEGLVASISQMERLVLLKCNRDPSTLIMRQWVIALGNCAIEFYASTTSEWRCI